MKNKIVKALVLASIVSMTATGAAGLTFAEEAPSGSKTTSETSTTIDGWAAKLTEVQKTATEKKAPFDTKYAYVEAQEKAQEANQKLADQEDYTQVAIDKARKAIYKTLENENEAPELNTGVTEAEAQAFAQLERSYFSLRDAEDAWAVAEAHAEALRDPVEGEKPGENEGDTGDNNTTDNGTGGNSTTDNGTGGNSTTDPGVGGGNEEGNNGASADSAKKQAYDNAKTMFESAKSIAIQYDLIKDKLETALNNEKAAREAFEAAMADIETKKTAADKVEGTLKTAANAYEEALTAVDNAKKAYDEATEGTVPIYRLYHPGTGEHLYTNSKNERDTLVKGGTWQDEKVAMLAANEKDDNAIPVYRLCYPLTGDHHYTTDKNEVTTLVKTQGWIDEHEAFYVVEEGTGVSVWRLYNSGLKLGAHHFTTGKNEYNTLKNHGWRQEGIAFNALAKDYVDTSAIKTEPEHKRVAKAIEANP